LLREIGYRNAEGIRYEDGVRKKRKEVIFYDSPFLHYLAGEIENDASNQFGKLEKKKVIYYGSGVNLRPAVEFVNQGATVYMTDISPKSTEFLNTKMKNLGMQERVFPMVMDCENLKFYEDEFDAVYGRAILHHLSLSKGLQEIWRVLKQNGIAVFIEPLGMNPLINLCRIMTLDRRTPYGKPLDRKDFKIISDARFSNFRHFEFTLLCNLGIFLNSVLKISKVSDLSYKRLKRIDDLVLTKFPFLRRFCWNTVLVMIK
jgi:SAM-dependent methyltransferase